ncbi:MAG: hemerythrin domain-containing protein [Bacteroidota bacterium]|nr:hemerythrin domain-containing protein [Bacteroidota bacterium]
MKATEQLKAEHEGIKLILKVMERISNKLEMEKNFLPNDLKRIIEFMKLFVYKCHHSKEEKILFPALEKAGIKNVDGPIEIILNEHPISKLLLSNLEMSLNKFIDRESGSEELVIKEIRNFICLMNNHINKENEILFLMAKKALSNERQEELYFKLEEYEERTVDSCKIEEFHNLLNEMKGRYLNTNSREENFERK